MAPYKRRAKDEDIIQLNSVGVSTTGIAEKLGIHHTTVLYRLKALGIPAVDTRRSFMEDVFNSLPATQQEWMINQLGPSYSVKDMIKSLITKEYVRANTP